MPYDTNRFIHAIAFDLCFASVDPVISNIASNVTVSLVFIVSIIRRCIYVRVERNMLIRFGVILHLLVFCLADRYSHF